MSPTAQLHQYQQPGRQAVAVAETLHPVSRETVRSLTASAIEQHAPLRYLMARADVEAQYYAAKLGPRQHAVLLGHGSEWALAVTGGAVHAPHLARDVATLIPPDSLLVAPSPLADGVAMAWNRQAGQRAELQAQDVLYVQKRNLLGPVPEQEARLLAFADTLPREQVAKEMSFCWLNVHHHFLPVSQFEQVLGTCNALLWRTPGQPLESFKLFTELGDAQEKGGRHILLGSSCGLPEHMPALFARLAALPVRVSALVSSDNEEQTLQLAAAGFRPARAPNRFSTYHLA